MEPFDSIKRTCESRVTTGYDWWTFVGTTAVTGSQRLRLREGVKRYGGGAGVWTETCFRYGQSPARPFSVSRFERGVDKARNYVRWIDMNGPDGVLGIFQGLNCLIYAPGPLMVRAGQYRDRVMKKQPASPQVPKLECSVVGPRDGMSIGRSDVRLSPRTAR